MKSLVVTGLIISLAITASAQPLDSVSSGMAVEAMLPSDRWPELSDHYCCGPQKSQPLQESRCRSWQEKRASGSKIKRSENFARAQFGKFSNNMENAKKTRKILPAQRRLTSNSKRLYPVHEPELEVWTAEDENEDLLQKLLRTETLLRIGKTAAQSYRRSVPEPVSKISFQDFADVVAHSDEDPWKAWHGSYQDDYPDHNEDARDYEGPQSSQHGFKIGRKNFDINRRAVNGPNSGLGPRAPRDLYNGLPPDFWNVFTLPDWQEGPQLPSERSPYPGKESLKQKRWSDNTPMWIKELQRTLKNAPPQWETYYTTGPPPAPADETATTVRMWPSEGQLQYRKRGLRLNSRSEPHVRQPVIKNGIVVEPGLTAEQKSMIDQYLAWTAIRAEKRQERRQVGTDSWGW